MINGELTLFTTPALAGFMDKNGRQLSGLVQACSERSLVSGIGAGACRHGRGSPR